MSSNTKVWTGLESAALALIFAPEPVSTFVGIGLLVFARTMRMEQQKATEQRRHYHNTFNDYYQYRLAMVRGASIAYNITTTKLGQLPLVQTNISRLHDPPAKTTTHHSIATTNARRTSPISAIPQQAGMLKTPVLKYETRFIGEKRIKP